LEIKKESSTSFSTSKLSCLIDKNNPEEISDVNMEIIKRLIKFVFKQRTRSACGETVKQR